MHETKSPSEKEIIYRLVNELDNSFFTFMLLDLHMTSRKVTYSSLDLFIFHISLTTLARSNRLYDTEALTVIFNILVIFVLHANLRVTLLFQKK